MWRSPHQPPSAVEIFCRCGCEPHLLLTYNKQWLYSGEFEGQTYDHAYFGDFETLQQVLTSASAELAFVEKK